MSDQTDNKRLRWANPGAGIGLGVGVGAAMMSATGESYWLAAGIAMGLALTAVFKQRNK